MGLDIRFMKKPSIGTGIHLVVDDGCDVNLNNLDQITEEQKAAIGGYNEPRRGKHLFYFNKSVTDMMISGGSIRLHCPVCGHDYEVTPQDYHFAFRRFQEDIK